MIAYIGLGSNLGDREATLREALRRLGELEGIEVVAVSAFRETDPVGKLDQPRFLNAAAALETDLPPRELLGCLLEVERMLGRNRAAEERWGPRTIDLDLLLYGDETIDEPLEGAAWDVRKLVRKELSEILQARGRGSS